MTDKKEESGEIERLPKKEAALLRREHEKLKHNLGGLREMTQVPDVVIVVDPKREATAIAECKKLIIAVRALGAFNGQAKRTTQLKLILILLI